MIKTVLIQNELAVLEELVYHLEEKNAIVYGATRNPEEGVKYVRSRKPDLVILGTDIDGTSGVKVAKTLRNEMCGIDFVFLADDSRYALEAYDVFPLDYILKPVDWHRFDKTLERANGKLKGRAQVVKKSLKIRCFGKFQVFWGKDQIKFSTQKSKVLLAYLICNWDENIRRDEIVQSLFGNTGTRNNLSNVYVTMHRLKKALIQDAQVTQLAINEDYSVEIEDNVCDFVDFCRFVKENKVINRNNAAKANRIIEMLNEEFLPDMDYPWVKEKREWLIEKTEDLIIGATIYDISRGNGRRAEEYLRLLQEMNSASGQAKKLFQGIYQAEKHIAKAALSLTF